MPLNKDFFNCKECGECCKGYGGTSVSEKNIKEIARFINADSSEFIKDYCVFTGARYYLTQKEDGFCIFWKNKLCSIHPVKPKMCKDWPFLKNVIKRPKNWLVMAEICPGINKNAPLEKVVAYINTLG